MHNALADYWHNNEGNTFLFMLDLKTSISNQLGSTSLLNLVEDIPFTVVSRADPLLYL